MGKYCVCMKRLSLRTIEWSIATLRPRYPTTTHFLAVVMLAGCDGGYSLPQQDYDSKAIASAALSTFDSNDDGKLNLDELQACLALQSAQARIDTNQDGWLEASEISARVTAYAAMSDYIVSEVVVKRGRRPIPGAEVTLKLTAFMNGDATESSETTTFTETTMFTTTTTASGVGMPQSSPESLLGFPPGFYNVGVVLDGKTWNFGVEIADDNPTVSRLVFDLTEE